MKAVSYYRVHAKDQGQSDLGLEAPRASVKSYLGTLSGTALDDRVEAESSKYADRYKLRRVLWLCRLTGAVLVVVSVLLSTSCQVLYG